MSGRPSPDGVLTFRLAVARMTAADTRIGVLEAEIAKLDHELACQREEHERAKSIAFDALEKMDVRSAGNEGWEDRAAYFYRELYRQLKGETR